MSDVRSLLEQGWSAIQTRFLDTLRTVAEGGDAGQWTSGLRAIAGTDYLNASTGRRYRGAFNRAMLANAIGPRLDRRVATACQLTKMGVPDPAVHGIARHAVILTPMKVGPKEEEGSDDTEDARVFFRGAAVFSLDTLRGFTAADGTKPWAALPSFMELPPAEWTAAHEDGALSLIPSLVAAFGARYEVGLVKSPHVAKIGDDVVVRMPDPAQQEGEEAAMLANRLSSFFHEMAHWTGFGGAGDALKRSMEGAHGSNEYAREELCAEVTATRMLQILGLEETDGFLAKKAAYVGGWAKPLLAGGADQAKLMRGVLEDVEKIVAKMVEGLASNAFFAARMKAIEEIEMASRVPEADEPLVSDIPDWRDADTIEALTPAQVERARASYEAKKAKGSSAASGSFEDFVRNGQRKRSRRYERKAIAA